MRYTIAWMLMVDQWILWSCTSQILSYFSQITRAEIKIANALVQYNIPITVTDHLSPLLKDILPDSDIAKGYASASTKTTCTINGPLALHF